MLRTSRAITGLAVGLGASLLGGILLSAYAVALAVLTAREALMIVSPRERRGE